LNCKSSIKGSEEVKEEVDSKVGLGIQTVNRDSSTLNQLILSHQNMRELPRNVLTSYGTTKELYIDNSQLAEFPIVICQLTQLQVLTLNNNQIKSVPIEITKLIRLERLELMKNLITSLNPAIEKLITLKQLTLSKNHLTSWPTEICKLGRLKTLHLHGNRYIRFMPTQFYCLNDLVEYGFDWLLYLSNSDKSIIRDNECNCIVSDIKNCCESYYKQNKTQINFLEFMERLNRIEKKDLITFSCSKGHTPFHLASVLGHTEIIKDFVEEELNLGKGEGEIALFLAVKYKELEIANLLVRSHKADVAAPCGRYGSIINYLITKKEYDLAIELSNYYNASVEGEDVNGNNVLHYIFSYFSSDPNNSKRLFNIMIKKVPHLVNKSNKGKLAPLHCAAIMNQAEAIELAIYHNKYSASKFDFNLKGGEYEFTILHLFALHMNFEVVSLLLENTNINIFAINYSGLTARQTLGNSLMRKILLRYERKITHSLIKRVRAKIVLNKSVNRVRTKTRSPEDPHARSIPKENKPDKTSAKNFKHVSKLGKLAQFPKCTFSEGNTSVKTINKFLAHHLKTLNTSKEIMFRNIELLKSERVVNKNVVSKRLKQLAIGNLSNYKKCIITYYIFKHSAADIEVAFNMTADKKHFHFLRPEILYLLGYDKGTKRDYILQHAKVKNQLAVFFEAVNAITCKVTQTTGLSIPIKVKRCILIED